MSRNQPGVITRTAGENLYGGDLWKHLCRRRPKSLVCHRTLPDRIAQACGLLEYLLQHEVLVIAEALVFCLKCQPGGHSFDDLPISVENSITVSAEFGEITVFQINKSICDRAERQGIGARKIFTDANTEHQWTALSRHHNAVWRFAVNDGQRIGTFKLG